MNIQDIIDHLDHSVDTIMQSHQLSDDQKFHLLTSVGCDILSKVGSMLIICEDSFRYKTVKESSDHVAHDFSDKITTAIQAHLNTVLLQNTPSINRLAC